MGSSEAQKEAVDRYNRANRKQLLVAIYPPDYDLYEYARSKGNVSGYVKRLIREDMEKEKEGEA